MMPLRSIPLAIAVFAVCSLVACTPTVTAEDLTKAWSSDPAAAAKIYGQAKIEFIGKIREIDEKASGQRVVVVTATKIPGVVLDNPPAAIAREGAVFDLVCTNTLLVGSDVHVAGCTIKE